MLESKIFMNLRSMKKNIEGITKTLRVMPIVQRQKGRSMTKYSMETEHSYFIASISACFYFYWILGLK